MARFILLVLASTILACEAKFKTGFAPCGESIILNKLFIRKNSSSTSTFTHKMIKT
jgi:hypothetical protein